MNKRKIFNDPVHGFIAISNELLLDIIDHPYFQRLRRIKQLGLTEYVYPGAINTRFHHALGATHLMQYAIKTLRLKGCDISPEEETACLIAILLHDIGHGPYSHTLEHCLSKDIKHEELSLLFMESLNKQFNGQLSLALEIFNDRHPKKFLHQLVSSQLDVDRLDYLARDSFFTGVSEGKISYQRIIDMMNVVDNQMVIEAKGIYSIEKFLLARRLMYWQVYFHKTVIVVEDLLIKVLERAKLLAEHSADMICSEALRYFLLNEVQYVDFETDPNMLKRYAQLDDHDIFSALKSWRNHPDKVMRILCDTIVDRQLFRIELSKQGVDKEKYNSLLKQACLHYELSEEDARYLVFHDFTSIFAYHMDVNEIKILFKDGRCVDMREASEQLDIPLLSEPVRKAYMIYPKHLA